MAIRTLTITATDAKNDPEANAKVTVGVDVSGLVTTPEGVIGDSPIEVQANAQGVATVTLWPSSELNPPSEYVIKVGSAQPIQVLMPDQDANLRDLRPAATGMLTPQPTGSGLPSVTADDNGRILQVANGAWAIVQNASARTFTQIAAGLNALTGNTRLSYHSLRDSPTIPGVATWARPTHGSPVSFTGIFTSVAASTTPATGSIQLLDGDDNVVVTGASLSTVRKLRIAFDDSLGSSAEGWFDALQRDTPPQFNARIQIGAVYNPAPGHHATLYKRSSQIVKNTDGEYYEIDISVGRTPADVWESFIQATALGTSYRVDLWRAPYEGSITRQLLAGSSVSVDTLQPDVLLRILPDLPAAGSRNGKVPKFSGDTLQWLIDSGLPEVSNAHNGNLLRVVVGAWSVVTSIPASIVSGLAAVATSGAYGDLTGRPTIPAAQVPSDWNANAGVTRILNKPTIPPGGPPTRTEIWAGTETYDDNASTTGSDVNLDIRTGMTRHSFDDHDDLILYFQDTSGTGLATMPAHRVDEEFANNGDQIFLWIRGMRGIERRSATSFRWVNGNSNHNDNWGTIRLRKIVGIKYPS